MKELRCKKCNKRLFDYEGEVGYGDSVKIQVMCKCKNKTELTMSDSTETINITK